MALRLLSKLNPADIDPRGVMSVLKDNKVGDTDTKTLVLLGTIIGQATGLSYRKNNFGDGPSIALKGIFEAIPADTNHEGARAPALFMPRAIQDMLVAAMLGADGDDMAPSETPKLGKSIDIDTGTAVKILFECSVRRNAAVGGAGYEFVVAQIGDTEKVDVLEQLRIEAGGGKKAVLAASPKPKQIAAPKSAKKAKKK